MFYDSKILESNSNVHDTFPYVHQIGVTLIVSGFSSSVITTEVQSSLTTAKKPRRSA